MHLQGFLGGDAHRFADGLFSPVGVSVPPLRQRPDVGGGVVRDLVAFDGAGDAYRMGRTDVRSWGHCVDRTGQHDERPGRSSSGPGRRRDRKSTRLNSSHGSISYAVFCLKKKKEKNKYKKYKKKNNKK